MTYTISAENLIGAVMLRRESVKAAAKKARELRDDGMWNVKISTDDGREVDEAALSQPPPTPVHH